jgi:hypothetical protein
MAKLAAAFDLTRKSPQCVCMCQGSCRCCLAVSMVANADGFMLPKAAVHMVLQKLSQMFDAMCVCVCFA